MLRVLRREDGTDGGGFTIARTFDDPRLELVRLLHEACEIEHSLMLQYLYAAYSLRPAYAALAGMAMPSSRTLLGVAIQEMQHLRDVNLLLVELGAAPNLGRQDFPYEPGIYPFAMTLEPLSPAALARYVYAEAPGGLFEARAERREAETALVDALRPLLPEASRLNHVGSLYGSIATLLDELDAPDARARATRWQAIVTRIRAEGEADHFHFFRDVFLGTHEAFAGRPPAWTDAAAPPSFPVTPAARTVALARLGNHVYWATLLLLDAGYRAERRDGAVLRGLANQLMAEGLHPIGQALAARHLGMPFDPLTIGYAPGVDVRRSLELAAEVLEGGATIAGTLAPDLDAAAAARLATLLQTTERRVRRAVRDGSSEVVIAGAGPAGLAAAAALTARGVAVRVVESAPVVGGKAHSLRTPAGRSVEHGVHGWWPSYLNFDRLLTWAGVPPAEALRLARGGGILTAPQQLAALRDLPVRLPSPLFVLGYLLRAPFLGARDLVRALPFAVHALAFRHDADYARYDGVSLAELGARLGVSPAFDRLVLRPFAMCFDYAPPEQVSAASILSAFQFYVLPTQQAIQPRWSRGLPQETIFGPIVHAITERGGIVDRRVALDAVAIVDGAVTGAWVTDTTAPVDEAATEVVARVPLTQVPATGFMAVASEAGTILVGMIDGTPRVYAATCPHAGGQVEWRDSQFVCRLHGGAFDRDGQVLRRPPEERLRRLEARVDGTAVEVRGTRRRTFVPCAHVVVATDVPHAGEILARSAGVSPPLLARLRRLRTTPVVVLRLWFRAGTRVPGIETIVLPAPTFADVYFDLNAIDASYDVEGVVVELHCCDVHATWTRAGDTAILDAAFRDLATLAPGLVRGALQSPDAYQLLRHASVFTLYAPGDHASRPGAASATAGLHLAGDWTAADWSVWMMERAVVSGLRAANRILAARGLAPVEIARLPPEGLLLRLARVLARLARRLLWRRVP